MRLSRFFVLVGLLFHPYLYALPQDQAPVSPSPCGIEVATQLSAGRQLIRYAAIKRAQSEGESEEHLERALLTVLEKEKISADVVSSIRAGITYDSGVPGYQFTVVANGKTSVVVAGGQDPRGVQADPALTPEAAGKRLIHETAQLLANKSRGQHAAYLEDFFKGALTRAGILPEQIHAMKLGIELGCPPGFEVYVKTRDGKEERIIVVGQRVKPAISFD